jgi:hypothetical protein
MPLRLSIRGTRLATGAKANKRLLVTLGVLAVLAHSASLLGTC